ncbi:chemotaxis protein [Pseudomonas sp. DWP3-1-2]|uniref:chemotaxis protein n=1 Tax=Pseudomonas sp. DWP3-1-2 TaxID=2804645 RepID=UPI003CF533AC
MWSPTLTAISNAFLRTNKPSEPASTEATADKAATGQTKTSESAQVTLSAAGQARAMLSRSSNPDIAQSGLPDSVQKILTSVRESQKGMDRLANELKAAMKDKNLTPEMRQAKVSALQTVSAIYQRQVSNTTSDLSSVMGKLKLSSADKLKASMLVMTKM